MNLQPQDPYFFCCHELLSITEALSRNTGSLSQRNTSTPAMGQVGLLLPVVPLNPFDKWLLGTCPLPGTMSHIRDSKLHKFLSYVVHTCRKNTEQQWCS